MTIAIQTPRSGPYSGDGSTVAFSYTFLIDDEDELVVVLADSTGAETVQTITADYTVSGVGSNSGGTVTMVTAPASGETLSMRRATDLDQGLDLQNRGSVVPQTVEDTFDELVKMIQDLQEQVDRSLLIALTSNTSGITVPAPSGGKLIGWNAGGTDLQNYTPNSGTYLTLPGSVTDNRVVRFNGTSGDSFQESGVTIDDNASISMSTINIDNLNTRIGIGDVSPDTDLDIYSAAPTIRLQDSTNDNIIDIISDTNGLLIDIDQADAASASVMLINIDNTTEFSLRPDDARITGNLRVGDQSAATLSLEVAATDAVLLPSGTTAQRPSGTTAGRFRYNSTTDAFEGYTTADGWGQIGGGVGLFKGENGERGDTTNGAGDIFRVHEAELNTDTTIDADENAMCAGPLTIASGVTLTVSGNLVIA